MEGRKRRQRKEGGEEREEKASEVTLSLTHSLTLSPRFVRGSTTRENRSCPLDDEREKSASKAQKNSNFPSDRAAILQSQN